MLNRQEIWNRAGRTGMAEPAWWFDIDYVIVELPVYGSFSS